jgi:hypothetical protein
MQALLAARFALADAQLVVAREYGFDSWTGLKHHVEIRKRLAAFQPHPRFDEAVAAMDAGDLERLRSVLAAEPALVRARTNLEPPYDYFTGATLLHHVAGNPDRGRLTGRLPPLPPNTADVARLLLAAGSDVHATTLGPRPNPTMGLVITSHQASRACVAGSLIDVLLEYGAELDLKQSNLLHIPLANEAPAAAEKLIELGARADVCAVAALGRMDWLRACFDAAGRLKPSKRAKPRDKLLSARDSVGLALLFAYVNAQPDAVTFLLERDGNWNMTGVQNGTALHRAAWAGDLAMLQRLVAKGADLSNRDNPFVATPLSWADHNGQAEVVRWMSAHCAIDLHDGVAFDLREQVEARLREDPASVDRRIDHWQAPQCTALHVAALKNRDVLAALLLERGANPNLLAGDGLTPFDVAVREHSEGVARLLEANGARRGTEL